MEFSKTEALIIERAARESLEAITELEETQLALIGGGSADVHFG